MDIKELFKRFDMSPLVSRLSSTEMILDLDEAQHLDPNKAVSVLIGGHQDISESQEDVLHRMVNKDRLEVRVYRVESIVVSNDDQVSALLGWDFDDRLIVGLCGESVSQKVVDNINTFHDSLVLVRNK